jgi:electron transfer flavoprotein alpha subunit
MTSILLVAELDEQGEINQPTLQAISAANGLDDAVVTVAIAGEAPSSANTLAVEKVVTLAEVSVADIGIYDQATADIFALFETTSPEVVIFGKSDLGSLVGARLAFRSDSAFAVDCIKVSNVGNGLSVTRPVYGGSALAEFDIASHPAIITLRTGAYEASSETGSPSIEPFDSGVTVKQVISVTGTVAEARAGVRLEDAKIVVSGGRGLGGPEPFSVLSELANALDGAVGASRAACDAGWIDHSHQIGLTGKSVSPDVYIAVGISGASQHMAGCASSKAIVAINKDADSNIFKEARFGIVGDWEQVLPSFIATVRELRA